MQLRNESVHRLPLDFIGLRPNELYGHGIEYMPYYDFLKHLYETNPEHPFFLPGGRFHDHVADYFPYY